jgi:hypothetical protein
VQDLWDASFGIKSSIENFIEQAVLQSDTKTVFCFDEVDRVFSRDYHMDFFAAVRGWHNTRAERPLWRNLTLLIAHSTDPSQWLSDHYQSPFNIGDETSILSDFDEQQTESLNRAYGSPLTQAEVRQLLAFTGGHPYLTRLALYVIRTRSIPLETLEDTAGDVDAPFGSHLRLHAAVLNHKPSLKAAFRRLLQTGTCEDGVAFEELYSAGLVSGSSAQQARVRCQLYQLYFQGRL